MRIPSATTIASLVLLAAPCALAGHARDARPLCADAVVATRGDGALARAVEVAFPKARVSAGNVDCAYPLKVVHYDDADVLLTLGAKPGTACRGCGRLSAYVLDSSPSSPTVVSSFPDAERFGGLEGPGDVKGVTLNGSDAVAVESGGLVQGRAATLLSFLAFREGRLERVRFDGAGGTDAMPGVPLQAGEGDARVGDGFDVQGTWRLGSGRPTTVTVDYVVRTRDGSRSQSATWSLADRTFVPVGGSVPTETFRR